MQNHENPEDKTKPPIFTSDKAPAVETPAQKMLQEIAIDRKKTKVLRPYIFLAFFMFATIFGVVQMIYSPSVYYLFNDRPKYEDLFKFKAKTVLLKTTGGKSGLTHKYLGIYGGDPYAGCSISNDSAYNYRHTEEHAGKIMEVAVDKFLNIYECKIDDVILRKYDLSIYGNEKSIKIVIAVFFILIILPFFLLLAYAIKNHRRDFTINHK